MKYTSPGGATELCTKPNHFPGIKYSDKDLKKEDTLCTYNFYKQATDATQPGVAVAICPKLVSTMPGVDVEELVGDKAAFESKVCAQSDRPGKKLAKFKQSMGCTYTGSILSYYHLSRILDASDVPAAVIRTMDTKQHHIITKRGQQFAAGSFIGTLWNQWASAEANPESFGDILFSKDRKQIYGAMVANPRGEDRYAEINMGSLNGFFASAPVKRLYNGTALSAIAGTDFGQSAAIVYQMKDISDMLVLDYIMSQQDRFGNIHRRMYYYWMENGKIQNEEADKLDEAVKARERTMPQGAVKLARMMLKDNDCGGRPGNEKRITDRDLQGLRHMSPKTYGRLRWLADQWAVSPAAKEFFRHEALLGMPDLFGNAHVDDTGANIKKAAAILVASCNAGTLKLDLDLGSHITGVQAASCDSVYSPEGGDSSRGVGRDTPSEPTHPTPPTPAPVPPPSPAPVPNPVAQCTEPSSEALRTHLSVVTVSNGPQLQFRARAQVDAKSDRMMDASGTYPFKLFLKYSETDLSNLALREKDGARVLEGIRYNISWNRRLVVKAVDLTWKCNQWEGRFNNNGVEEPLIIKP